MMGHNGGRAKHISLWDEQLPVTDVYLMNTIMNTMNYFDQAAKNWDSNPMHWERSTAIAEKIMQKIELHPGASALEYGAGTAILSFLLKDALASITLMDNSIEMVKVMQEKIETMQVPYLEPLWFNLETTEYHAKTFDLVFTQMVLHHIDNVELIVSRFYDILNRGGSIAIADLYREDGSFHGQGFTGHLGFDVTDLLAMLERVGFKELSHELCFVVKRQTEKGDIREYPVFIITGTK